LRSPSAANGIRIRDGIDYEFPGRAAGDAHRVYFIRAAQRQTAGKSDFLFDVRYRSARRAVSLETICRIFPPFAILFLAFSWQAFQWKTEPQLPEDFQRDLKPYLDAPKQTEKERYWEVGKLSALWALGLILFVFFVYNLTGFNRFGINESGLLETIRGNEENDKYSRAMLFATGSDDEGRDNIPAGERIFNCNWDDFPKLFFYNTKHSYVYGLDPNYLYSENPELYKLLIDLTNGKIDDPAPVIREKFGANYIFADAKENDDMLAKALESGWAEMIYEDDEARILRIRPEKGEPAKDAVVDDSPPTPEELKQLEEEEKAANANADKPANDEDEEQ
jgi:hypothetical protein